MKRLGDLERKVMDVLWDAPGRALTGRQVSDQLGDRAYTTVLTILNRLRRKGMVQRTAEGRIHRFTASDTRESYMAELMIDAMDDSGDRGAVLVRFAESVSSDEAKVLRRALDEAKRKRPPPMTLVLAAVLLGALSVVLVGPATIWLAGASWVSQAPRSAVILWQCIGLSSIASGIGAGLAVAGCRYHAGFGPGLRDLFTSLFDGHPLQGLGVPNALGLTLAADLLIVLFACFGSLIARTVKARARHRRLLNLLARRSSDYPGTDLIDDSRPVAYCLPGRRPRIVVSEGALQLLSSAQAQAVIDHERGHAHGHHGLVMLPMDGVRKLFAWVPYARLAPSEIASLLEMSADDYSAKRSDPVHLAIALVRMATSEHVPGCAFGADATPFREELTASFRIGELRGGRRWPVASVLASSFRRRSP